MSKTRNECGLLCCSEIKTYKLGEERLYATQSQHCPKLASFSPPPPPFFYTCIYGTAALSQKRKNRLLWRAFQGLAGRVGCFYLLFVLVCSHFISFFRTLHTKCLFFSANDILLKKNGDQKQAAKFFLIIFISFFCPTSFGKLLLLVLCLEGRACVIEDDVETPGLYCCSTGQCSIHTIVH